MKLINIPLTITAVFYHRNTVFLWFYECVSEQPQPPFRYQKGKNPWERGCVSEQMMHPEKQLNGYTRQASIFGYSAAGAIVWGNRIVQRTFDLSDV